MQRAPAALSHLDIPDDIGLARGRGQLGRKLAAPFQTRSDERQKAVMRTK